MDGCRTRRLRALAAHVRAISPASKAAPLALTAEQLQRFVIDGYIAVQLADLPPAFHTEAAAMAQRHRDNRTGGQLGAAAAESLDREAKSVLDAVKRSSMAHGAFASFAFRVSRNRAFRISSVGHYTSYPRTLRHETLSESVSCRGRLRQCPGVISDIYALSHRSIHRTIL
jgi:hypothetical protein